MNQSNASHVATDYLWGKLRQLICKVVKENTEKKKKCVEDISSFKLKHRNYLCIDKFSLNYPVPPSTF